MTKRGTRSDVMLQHELQELAGQGLETFMAEVAKMKVPALRKTVTIMNKHFRHDLDKFERNESRQHLLAMFKYQFFEGACTDEDKEATQLEEFWVYAGGPPQGPYEDDTSDSDSDSDSDDVADALAGVNINDSDSDSDDNSVDGDKCVKCGKKVPEKWEGEEYAYCIDQGWYCPQHSPATPCNAKPGECELCHPQYYYDELKN